MVGVAASCLDDLAVDSDSIGSILVVQRDPRARQRFCRSLLTAGYRVAEIDSFTASGLSPHNPPDLVIQDIGYPGTDCHEVARELRGHFGKSVPILGLTGFLCQVDEQRAMQSGFSHVLVKPVDPDHLVEVVGSFLMPRLDGITESSARDGQRVQSTHRATQLAVLAGAAEALANSEPLDDVLGRLLDACLDMAGISEGALYLVVDGVLRLKHENGFTPSEIESLHARLGCGAFLTTVANGEATVLVPSASVAQSTTKLLLRNSGGSSLLLVPVRWCGTAQGLMLLGTREADISGDDVVSFANVLGSQMGFAIGLTQTFTKLAASEQRYRNLTETASELLVASLANQLHDPLATVIASLDATCDPALHAAREAAQRIRVIVDEAKAFSRGDERYMVATARVEPSRRGRVLVVDDDDMVRNTIARTLTRDHEVVTAADGAAALEAITTRARFDVILCDLMMPRMTGIELYQRLGELVPEQLERVVFLTGGMFTPEARQFLDSIPNVCVEKPYNNTALRALVSKRVG